MEVRYKRREKTKHYLTVKENENKLHAIFYRNANVMKIQIDWYHPLYENNKMRSLAFVEEIIKEAKKIGEIWGTSLFYVAYKNIPEDLLDYHRILDYFYTNWIKAEKKMEMVKQLLGTRNVDFKKEDYLLFDEEAITKKLIDYVETFEKVIEEKRKEDPTVTIMDRTLSTYNANYKIYYEGIQCKFNLSFAFPDRLFFQKDSEVEELNLNDYPSEIWEEKWKKEFGSLCNKQRVKTIFNPPDYHQKNNREKLSEKFFVQEGIIEDLKTKYNPKELEILFALSKREDKIGYYNFAIKDTKVGLSYVENNFYVYDESDRGRNIFIFKDKELAKDKYNELIRLKCEEELERQNKFIDKYL